jgi:predicted nucleic acid-binding protein
MEHPSGKSKHNNSIILIDADAFIALVKEDDTNHARAVELLERLEPLPITFVTTNYVFSEVITVISQRVGHTEAVQFADSLKSPQSHIQIRQIETTLDDKALHLFREQSSKNTSFVDCSNMALLEYYDVQYIFSFDAVYKSNGYLTADRLVAS